MTQSKVDATVKAALKTLKGQLLETKQILAKPRVMLDFETRSHVNLKDVGAFIYSRHPSTEVLMVTWKFQGTEHPTQIWKMGRPMPKELIDAAQSTRYQLNAFNSFFEYCIWQNVCAERLGWGELSGVNRFLDVQDKAKTMALPAGLDQLGEVTLAAAKKDKEGKRLIQKFCTPRRVTKANPDLRFEDPFAPENSVDWKAFCKYGLDDTRAQVYQDETLPDLIPKEQLAAWMTNEMNWNGLHIDLTAVLAAEFLVSEVKRIYNARASKLSGGAFEKCTQRAKVKAWLEDNYNFVMPNMQGDTVDMRLRDKKIPLPVRSMLEYYKVAGSTSVAKYTKLKNTIDLKTRRVHELLSFHRARTGRYGGKGFQIQNLPRPVLPKDTNYDDVIALLKKRDYKLLEKYARKVGYTPTQVLLSCIRAIITPLVGEEFTCGDYASIEARCLLWEAQDAEGLDIFRRGEDIYLYMASDIYNVPMKSLNKGSKERPLGKEAVLGCGYEMGWKKFRDRVDSQANIQITAAESKKVIDSYRKKFHKVPLFWRWIEKVAMSALLKHNGKHIPKEYNANHKQFGHLKAFDLSFIVEKYGKVEYLVCILPNKKRLYYPHPKIVAGRFGGYSVQYEGVEAYIAGGSAGKGSGGKWGYVDTYGGKLVENVTQAIARELLIAGMLMLRAANYSLVMTVHDEVTVEHEIGYRSVEEFNALFKYTPKWAATIPVEVETYQATRYRK